MNKLSVIIITKNEERNLARCLASVATIADEIVVVDSFSTDGTPAVAQQYGAKFYTQDFLGYAQQKNLATSYVSNDWVLSLDADEELTEELRVAIAEALINPYYVVYKFSRLTNYCGQWIKHCGWYPDWQTRLYNRTKGKWIEKRVHEYWAPLDDTSKKGVLKGDLLHYSFTSLSQHLQKIEKYTELAAIAAVEEGKKASVLKIILSPFWHFVSEYIVKLGFLDGFNGYLICKLSAYTAFVKYSKIRLYRKR